MSPSKPINVICGHLLGCGLLVGIALAGNAIAAGTEVAPTIFSEYQTRLQEYCAELQSLADELEGLPESQSAADKSTLADRIRAWSIPAVTNRDWLFVPSNAAEPPALPSNAKFASARQRYARRLWGIAERAADAGQYALAVQLAHHTYREDPTHEAARAMVRVEDSVQKIQTGIGKTRNRTYNWPAGEYCWARSDHFQLLTNCDEEVARSLVHELEILYDVWSQLFAEFQAKPEVFQRSWQRGGLPGARGLKHRVVLFSSRNEYIRQLRHWEPKIAVSEGVYRFQQRTAFFFHDGGSHGGDLPLANLRHEVIHQLFHESTVYGGSKGAGAGVGESQDFWAIEGVAMYFETMQARSGSHQGYYTVAGPEAERLQFARHRALSAKEYTPLADFTMKGRASLQSDPRVRQLYSQAGGLAHFFLLGEQRRYREFFGQYLRNVYAEKRSKWSLAQRAKVSFAELDDQYMQFLSLQDADLDGLAADTKRLSLGNTRITPRGADSLRVLADLRWLDLSNTRMNDEAITRLSQLSNLKTLWLSGVDISDASIPALAKLSQLTELDLRGTKITAEGRQRLRAALPHLETLLPSN